MTETAGASDPNIGGPAVSHFTVYVTCPNRAAALKLGRAIVESRLAACANVLDGATSIYWWEGKINEESEAVLLAKTTAEKLPALTAKIKELHDYSCPCVVAWPILGGNQDYLDWISRETAEKK